MLNNETISKTTIAEQVAEKLLINIFNGTYEQGQRLIESEIAETMNVSHAPVREALYILQKHGVVKKERHKGVRVKKISDKELADYLTTLNYLLIFAIDNSKNIWSEEHESEFLKRYNKILLVDQTDVIHYVLAVANLLKTFFDIINNKAMLRFFEETTFITNIGAQSRWDSHSIKSYQQSIDKFKNYICDKDFETSKVIIKDVINWLEYNEESS